MRNFRVMLLPVVLAILSLCVSCVSYTVETLCHDGAVIDRMDDNTVSYTPRIELNAQRYTSRIGKPSYSLIVVYGDDRWLYIDREESLVLLIDGARLALTGDGSLGHRVTLFAGNIVEKAWYDISFRQLQKIATASEVEINIIGRTNMVKDSLSRSNIDNLQRFCREYGPLAPSARHRVLQIPNAK